MARLPKKPGVNPQICFDYEDWLRYEDLQRGIIRIDTHIESYDTSEWLMELEQIKDRKEITLVISSPGGAAYHALALYDALRKASKKSKIIGIVEGWAASAAAMIVLQAADERISRPNSRFLLHEVRRWAFFGIERTSDLKDEMKEMQAIEEQIIDILVKRCKKTPKEVKKTIERKEAWMSAKEAKDWGLIDRIE